MAALEINIDGSSLDGSGNVIPALEQGATFDDTCYPPLVLRYPPVAPATVGDLFDLTDYSARSMIRKKFVDADPVASFTTTIDVVEGSIRLSLTATETAAIPAGNYVYDVEIYTDADAIVRRVVKGKITVDPEATK